MERTVLLHPPVSQSILEVCDIPLVPMLPRRLALALSDSGDKWLLEPPSRQSPETGSMDPRQGEDIRNPHLLHYSTHEVISQAVATNRSTDFPSSPKY